MHDDDEQYEEDGFEGPSKSELKRQMHALQAMGERLVQLPDSQLARINIEDEALAEAVALARRIKSRSGLKRQLQFIGKLMRRVDATAIEEGLALLDGQHQAANARFHKLENLRDKLLQEGDSALSNVIAEFPQADRSHLRQLLRQHSKSLAAKKPSSVPKILFRYLRELDEED
jgi:ribosome-associated protein